jgi:hypothetical protein
MDLVIYVTVTVGVVCFLTGAAITAITGKARPVRILLAVLSAIFLLALAGGLVVSRGLLIYLLFQIIAVIILLYFFVIAGAVCGGGIYLLLHRKSPGQKLQPSELPECLSIDEFARVEGIEPERLMARIKSGFYRGGHNSGGWYVHREELSPPTTGDSVITAAPLSTPVRKGKLSR